MGNPKIKRASNVDGASMIMSRMSTKPRRDVPSTSYGQPQPMTARGDDHSNETITANNNINNRTAKSATGSNLTVHRVLFHQTLDVSGVTLAHCDRVWVNLVTNELQPNETQVRLLCEQLYESWLTRGFAFARVLEVNFGDSVAKFSSRFPSMLFGVVSGGWNTELICTAIGGESMLHSPFKCLEMTGGAYHPRTQHIVTPNTELEQYKCLMIDTAGWLLVLDRSHCWLLFPQQYVAVALEHNVYITESIRGNDPESPNHHLVGLTCGSALMVRHGAMVLNANAETVFIGQTIGPPVSHCSLLQAQLKAVETGGRTEWDPSPSSMVQWYNQMENRPMMIAMTAPVTVWSYHPSVGYYHHPETQVIYAGFTWFDYPSPAPVVWRSHLLQGGEEEDGQSSAPNATKIETTNRT